MSVEQAVRPGLWRWPVLAMSRSATARTQLSRCSPCTGTPSALSDADATAIFGVYVLGLIPGS